MKTLLIFAFTIALAVSAVPPNLSKYLPNKEYVYNLETEALTGIPAASNHLAGIKVLAKVHLQLKGANKFLLALRDVRICEVNDKVKTVHHITPVETGPGVCTPIQEPEINTVLQENLVKPIRFRWENGQVSLLQTDEAEAYWSVNLKRGILSVLNVNLQELEALPTMPESLREAIKAAVPSSGARTLNNLFRVMERDIVGECESIYALQEEPGQTPVITVTKVRNFDSCISRPVFQTGLLAALHCHHCSERLPLRSQAYANYTLVGNRQEFVIKSAVQVGHFIFKPFASIDGQAMTFTKIRIDIVDVADSASEMPLGKKRKQRDPFTMEVPSTLTHLARETATGTGANVPINVIEEMITNIVTMIENPEAAIRVPDVVAELVLVLRGVPIAQLKELVNKLCVESAEVTAVRKREIILDVLATTGRSDIVPVLNELIAGNKISTIRASVMINMLALTAEPAPILIKELLELHETHKQHVQLARSIILAAGTLTHTLNKIYVSTHIPKEVAVPARDLIVKEFKKLLNAATAHHEKLMVFKALGNAGLAEFIPLLEPTIQDTKINPELRSKAIYALRRVTHLAKHKIHQICVPIILTPEEPLKVRIAALLITAHTRPESGIFTMIAQQIARDPSVQFTNFAWFTLKAIAASELPCNRNISEAAAAAIREVYTMFPGRPLSKTINYEVILSYIHHLGAEIALDLVTPGVSALPETVVTRVNAYFAKSLFNIMEVGVETKGLLTVLRNLFGPEGQWMQVFEGKKSLGDIVSPILDPSLWGMEGIRNFIHSIANREMSGLAASIYIKLFGNEMRFFNLDNAYIKQMINEIQASEATYMGKLAAGLPINIMKTLALVNQAVILPTPIGMPVSLNITTATVITAKGSLKLDGIASLSEILSGTPTIHVKYDIKPTIATVVTGAMGVHFGMVKAATAVKAKALIRTPMKGAAAVELPSAKIHVTHEVPAQEEKVVKIAVEPVALIIKEIPVPTTKFFTITETPIYNPDIIMPIDVELPIGRESLGVEVVVKGKYARPISILAPIRVLCMPHKIEVAIRPASGAPKAIEIIAAYVVPGTPEAEAIKRSVLAGEGTPVANSWFSTSGANVPIEFEPVHPVPAITSPIQRQVIASVRTKGHATPRAVATQITVITEEKFSKIQTDIQVAAAITSPTPTITKIETILTIPPVMITSAAAPTSPEELAVIRIAYGPHGHTAEYATLKWLYRVLQMSEYEYVKESVVAEMKAYPFEKVDTSYSPPTTYNRASRYSFHSYADIYRTPNWTPVRPLQISCEIEYKPITVIPEALMPMVYRTLLRVLAMPEYFYFPKGSVLFETITNTPNKVTAVITTLPNTSTMEVLLRLPSENIRIQGIRLIFPQLFYPYKGQPLLPEVMKRITGGPVFAAECAVRNAKVKTFDMVEYTLPETTCETILAQDCSSRKLFRITAMKAPAVPSKKIVKAMVGPDVIEIVPSGANRVELKVNGAVKTVAENTPVEITGSSNQVICHVVKRGATVHITEKKLGINIETDCSAIKLALPAWFSGEVCGMCGNFDTEKVGDVRGPHNERYPHPENAIADYILPTPNCDAALIRDKFKSSAAPSASCNPTPETVYIEHTEGNQKLACFSERTVMVCPSTCRAVGQKSVEMPFHCLPADLPSTQQLLDRLKRSGHLPPLTEKTKTIRESVLTSPVCQPPY